MDQENQTELSRFDQGEESSQIHRNFKIVIDVLSARFPELDLCYNRMEGTSTMRVISAEADDFPSFGTILEIDLLKECPFGLENRVQLDLQAHLGILNS